MLNNLCASRAFSLEFELSVVITFDVGLSKHALLYEPTASKQAVLHSPFQISSFSIFSLVYYGSTLFDIHLVSTVFISFYILDCRCHNKLSIGIVQLSCYGMHCFCGRVLKCISMDQNVCSLTLITVAIFMFCLSSTQMCISDCVWNAAIEACACMIRWATIVAAYLYATWITLIFMSIVSLSWWIEDALNCGIWSLRSDTLLLCLF